MKFRIFSKVTTLGLTTATMLSSSIMLTPRSAFAGVASIGQQLINAAIAAGSLSHVPTHDPYINTLLNGRSHLVTINLHSGVAYNLVSVCDEYCRDVDLKLYDGNYNLISSDTRPNDVSIISVVPYRSGQFYLEVDMADCNANYCYYGVGVFGR